MARTCSHCDGTGKCQDDYHSGVRSLIIPFEDEDGVEHPSFMGQMFEGCPSCGEGNSEWRPDCPHCDGSGELAGSEPIQDWFGDHSEQREIESPSIPKESTDSYSGGSSSYSAGVGGASSHSSGAFPIVVIVIVAIIAFAAGRNEEKYNSSSSVQPSTRSAHTSTPESVVMETANSEKSAFTPSDITDGKELYAVKCADCHGMEGEKTLFGPVPLAESEMLLGPPDKVVQLILNGKKMMPPYSILTNAQVANVTRFVFSLRGVDLHLSESDIERPQSAPSQQQSAPTVDPTFGPGIPDFETRAVEAVVPRYGPGPNHEAVGFQIASGESVSVETVKDGWCMINSAEYLWVDCITLNPPVGGWVDVPGPLPPRGD